MNAAARTTRGVVSTQCLIVALCLLGTASAAQNGRSQLVASIKPSIAKVIATQPNGDETIGTAFMIARDTRGYLLTNCHVAAGAKQVEVQFLDAAPGDVLHSDLPIEATVKGCDPWSDLAVLEIEPSLAVQLPPPLPAGNPANIAVGDTVMTIGFARNLGGDPSVNFGTINGLNRAIGHAEDASFEVEGQMAGLIQTDATINHGNSGGPLMNMRGEWIGVNTYTTPPATPDQPAAPLNIFFARSIETAAPFSRMMIATGRVARGDLGLDDISTVIGDFHTVPLKDGGVKIISFGANSPGQRAGLRAGDVITSLWPCPNYEQAQNLTNRQLGQGVDLNFACTKNMLVPNVGTLMNLLGTAVRPAMYVLLYVFNPNPPCASQTIFRDDQESNSCLVEKTLGRQVMVKLN